MSKHLHALSAAAVIAALASYASANDLDQQPFRFPSQEGMEEKSELGEDLSVYTPKSVASSTFSVNPAIERDFIVYGYIQSDTPRWAYHWHALTHVSLPFTGFDANGDLTNAGSTITGRSILFQPGGIAARHGVKVKMTLINRDPATGTFSSAVLNSVMQNASRRTNLAQQVAAIVNNPADNIAGVNLDFEPLPYGITTALGIESFITELRGLLNPGKELTYYVGPQYSFNNYPNIGALMADLDYVTFSCYPWGGSFSGSPNSITPYTSYRNALDNFIAAGVPPEKIVLTLGSYGHRWNADVPSGDEADAYNSTSITSLGSHGFADSRFEVTLSQNAKTRRWRANAESPWFASLVSGTTFRTVVYEDEESMEFKLGHALAWPGNQGTGRRMAGVGFWSLAWFNANFIQSSPSFSSWDMETNASANKIRTYPHVYQLLQEILAAPGTTEYLIEKWEYDSPSIGAVLRSDWDRWRDPAGGVDNVGVSSVSRAIVATPAGPGTPPANSDYGNQLSYSFSATANNRFFYRWELLGHRPETTVVDRAATRGFFPLSSTVKVDVYTASSLPNATLRFVIIDGNGELERGPALSLNASGWRTLEWDLTTGGVSAYVSNYNQYTNGNGVIDTAGPGARDIAVIGFLVEGGGVASSGSLILDELRWSPAITGGDRYVINEFRYAPNDGEFIEIYGPAGVIPNGVEIRLYDGDESGYTPYSTISLAGLVVPASGILAVGDPAVAGVANSDGFSNAVDNIRAASPGGIQIYDALRGEVHDSVLYRAWGGIKNLTRQQTNGITREGYPWLGEIGSTGYTKGRFPDGNDTNFNYADFSVMPATPGQPNGSSIPPGTEVTYDFDTVPPGAFQTYQSFSVGAPHVSLPPLPPGTGSNVYRAVDTSGGGVIGFIGDAALGSSPHGYSVTGWLYIPTTSEPQQAIAVGIAGTQGSTFFTGSPANSGYETGYWLIFENRPGVGLANSRADHPEAFEFVMATNTNQGPNRSVLLGSANAADLGVTAGNWVEFEFDIDPTANTLAALINGNIVYTGPIPEGGPTRGAFQVGFRENHAGGPAANEGTWLASVTINNRDTEEPTSINDWYMLTD